MYLIRIICLLIALLLPTVCRANDPAIDAYVKAVMEAFHIPGAAIGVIKDGQVVHMAGYGIADIASGKPVDEYTLFKIASNTKAFTSAGLAIQVESGELNWSDKVADHLADFKMYEDYATREFTVVDILAHRSGLGLGAGDMMLWPEPTRFTREMLVKNLRYLKPAYGFRERYAYDNTLYIVAGEISAAIADKSWEDHVEQAIMKPLGMRHCHANPVDPAKIPNVVAPHLFMNGKLIVDEPNRIQARESLMAAAGGIKCSVHDLLIWIDLQLRGGVSREGVRLFSEKQRDRMWYPVTPLTVSERAREMDNTHFRGYALGWRVNDFRGQWMVSHTGTLSGAMSQITLLPDSDLGIIVLINQSSGYGRHALTRGLLQHYLAPGAFDWLKYNLDRQAQRTESEQQTLPPETAIEDNRSSRKRLGVYRDPWFGKIRLKRQGDDILFSADMSPRMQGKVYAHDDNTWWVKWDNRSFEADSWIRFERKEGKLHMTMERIFEDSDWSFDVQDLNFIKVRW